MSDPVKTIENLADGVLADRYIPMLISLIISALPAWLSWLGGPFSWILGYLLKKVGHAAVIEVGNAFIGLQKAAQAVQATDEAKNLNEVLKKPEATPEEIENANKKFDDAYSRLISLPH